MYILIDLFALTVFLILNLGFFLNQHETNVSNLDDQTMANLLKLDLWMILSTEESFYEQNILFVRFICQMKLSLLFDMSSCISKET